ncbi:zinc ribbon domain-containing protein [Aerosakkonema sp. BLCC-F183]|uniref:zinc ribbon domain-containing protein n=1 Tax=Aerosakkonema sp. BLCC-F183 TaxID=3342834 RepID=UPI0035B8F6BF
MVKNHHLAKSISDTAQLRFCQWLEYVGKIFGVTVIAVAPDYTFRECSSSGEIRKQSRDLRAHRCFHCGYVEERDVNTNKNILRAALCQ